MAIAKFESNISSGRGYDTIQQKSLSNMDLDMGYQDNLWISNSNNNILDSIFGGISSFFHLLIVFINIWIVVFAIFFLIYIIISLFKKWANKTLDELKSFWKGTIQTLSYFFNIIKKISLKIFYYFWNRKILSLAIFLLFVLVSFIWNVVDGKSKILKLVKINPWFVWVDLKNNTISHPWYHLYSPMKSWFFLSPTNNFSFDIVDVKANSKEDLAVTLEYRATFKLLDNKRLQLYKENWAKNIRFVSSDIVMPRILEVINWVIKNYSFKDISNKHWEIKTITIKEANKVLTHIWIEIKDLNILSIKLPDSYIKSKEDLLKAENELKLSQARLESQKKESEKRLLEAQNSKKVKIIEAEALAEYNKIINSQELTPAMIQMKRLEIEELKIQKWDGKMPNSVGEGFEL